MRRSFLIQLFVLPLLVLGCSHSFRANVQAVGTHDPKGATSLLVETDNGTVNIKTDELRQDIAVTATITGSGMTTEEADRRASEIRYDLAIENGAARLFVIYPDSRRPSEGVAFDLVVPALTRIEVRTGNGEVSIADTHADVSIDTSNGTVTARRHVGSLKIDTSNGGIDLDDVAGELNVKSSNGGMRIVAGPDGIAHADLHTSNGGIDLALGAGFDGSVDAETSNGWVDDQRQNGTRSGSRKECVIRYGDGPISRIRTSNGNIIIR